MKTLQLKQYVLVLFFVFTAIPEITAQICGASVPTFTVDLTGKPDSTWTSPLTSRNDLCCGTVSTDVCVQFILTLDAATEGINVNILQYVPGGFNYQINCGQNIPMGNNYCLAGGNTYTLTHCRPGNSTYNYRIQALLNAAPATPTITQSGNVLTSSSSAGNQWYLNGSPISGGTSQTYTVTQSGDYSVISTQYNCTSVPSATVHVIFDNLLEQDNLEGVHIFPNPNSGSFNVLFTGQLQLSYVVEIRNVLGELIFKDKYVKSNGENLKTINLHDVTKGIYTVSIKNGENEILKKIIIY